MHKQPDRLVFIRDGALPTPLFQRLLRKVHSIGKERLGRTYETTFWFELKQPSNVVEEAILALRPLVPVPGSVLGVEWWLSRMHTSDVRVDFHRDRDEKLAERTGRIIHPKVSSVLFLNRAKGGLLAVSGNRPNDQNPARAPSRVDFSLVRPHPNRLAFFDGNRTHGVLDAYNRLPRARGRGERWLRLAVVVNWWHRRPLEVPLFSETAVYRSLVARRRSTDTSAPMRR
jgi:hypothetical protein